MSVPPTTEGVNSTVITPLVATTAAVLQDTIWMRMDSTVMVRVSSLKCLCIIEHISRTSGSQKLYHHYPSKPPSEPQKPFTYFPMLVQAIHQPI